MGGGFDRAGLHRCVLTQFGHFVSLLRAPLDMTVDQLVERIHAYAPDILGKYSPYKCPFPQLA